MTVIAWDGTTLAADRQAECAGMAYSVTKIFECGDVLVGVSGDFARGVAMVEWLRSGADPELFPKEENGEQYVTMLVVHRDGRVLRYESGPYPIPVKERTHAVGSGREFAMMALHLGRSAAEAVALTCELSTQCGRGVDALTFE